MKRVLLILSFLLLGAIALSVCYVGLHYVFDIDEFYHVQIDYYFSIGEHVYKTFYLTPYTPVFHWILLPFLKLTHFDFSTMLMARYVMIGFFLIRSVVLYLLVKLLVNQKTAMIALAFTLIDPVTSYSVIQVRPDNVMLVFYLLALLLFTYAWKKNKEVWAFFAGIALAISGLTLLKIAPAAIVFTLFVMGITLFNKKINLLRGFIAGGILPVLLFLGYFYINGTLQELIQETIIYPQKFFATLAYPIPFAFFNRADNARIFGVPGRPITYFLAWFFYLSSGAGIYAVGSRIFHKKRWTYSDGLFLVLAISFLLQYYWILAISSVFIQYYQPVLLLGAILSAYALNVFLEGITVSNIRTITHIGLFMFFVYLSYTIVTGNINKQQFNLQDQKVAYEKQWQEIPVNEKVFPSYLFRPFVYPVSVGVNFQDMNPEMLKKFPDVYQTLVNSNFKYHAYDQYYDSFLPENAKNYLYNEFAPMENDPNIFVKKQ